MILDDHASLRRIGLTRESIFLKPLTDPVALFTHLRDITG